MNKPTQPIELRLTHSYTTGWRHLDQEMYLATGHLTKSRVTESDKSGDGWTERQLFVLTPAQLAEARSNWATYVRAERARGNRTFTFSRAMELALSNTFARGCQCEHDCCGHLTGYTVAHQVGRRTFALRHELGRNY